MSPSQYECNLFGRKSSVVDAREHFAAQREQGILGVERVQRDALFREGALGQIVD